jgi:hypothetical protein
LVDWSSEKNRIEKKKNTEILYVENVAWINYSNRKVMDRDDKIKCPDSTRVNANPE